MTKDWGWSERAISFDKIKKQGKYLGYYHMWADGIPGGELWKMEVWDVDGELFGGTEVLGYLEPMLDEKREEILRILK